MLINFLKQKFFLLLLLFVYSSSSINAQYSNVVAGIDIDTVKAGQFDTGKMWTFDFPPVKYLTDEYNFKATDEWLEKVRKAALRFANYCSASFVSADGLVMTNHHCSNDNISAVELDGEDLQKNGFIAFSLEEERKVPGLYVDQLVLIRDVTSEVIEAIDKGTTDQEKSSNKKDVIAEIEKRYKEETGLVTSVITFYNGGKYSLYGYKRYSDVRLVFAPDNSVGYFGGDPDNFTYPRYNLDCAFYRVYDEDGNPLNTDYYYKWSEKGADPGELVFVVGNPGSTNRLFTYAQLEYQRDVQFPRVRDMLNGIVDVYKSIIKEDPSREKDLQNTLFSLSNSQKVYNNLLSNLHDPFLMKRKKDFEDTFKSKVNSDSKLKSEYSDLWDKISGTRKELSPIANVSFILTPSPLLYSKYFFVAQDVVKLAEEIKSNTGDDALSKDEINERIGKLMPEDFDYLQADLLLSLQLSLMKTYASELDEVQKLLGGKNPNDAAKYLASNSVLRNSESIKKLFDKGADAVLNSDDPFINFVVNTKSTASDLRTKITEITTRESSYTQKLGRALFEVYGTSFPPDATFSLRISDGVVKGYDYNGTVAPAFTTFYGMYDRYYSNDGKYPWNLHERWLNPSPEFNLSTPYNFVATADIVGGNSGSAVINKNGEVVGLAFDGNIESLSGSFIFTTDLNRMVSVHSAGMMESIKHIYKLNRLSDELIEGKIPAKHKLPVKKITE